MVSMIGPLFRTAGHVVRTQHGVTASAGQRRGDVEIRPRQPPPTLPVAEAQLTKLAVAAGVDRSYLRDQAGSRSLVFDLSIAHDRFGSSSHVLQNGNLTHPQDLDGPLPVAAQDQCLWATIR